MKPIYLDYAATTPVDPIVIEAMTPYFYEKFGNATSSHSFGREAQSALEESRETLANVIGAKSSEIIFNSGATEGSNHVLFSLCRKLKEKGNHIIVSPIEHHCVLEPIEKLEKEGFKVTHLKVGKDGLVDPQDVKQAITDQTILIAVMQANNEIGTIQPIAEIGKIAEEKEIVFFVDAVQAIGHIPVDVKELKADFLTLSAHKFYGPKGIGALYIKEGNTLPKFLLGGGQERGLRGSTQNVAGAVGLAKAISLCKEKLDQEMKEQIALRDGMIDQIFQKIDGVHLNGHKQNRLPNNIHLSFEKLQGESLLMSLDMAGFAASMGSACTSGAMEISHVLKAIGIDEDLAYGSLRLTIGRWTTQEHIDVLLQQLPNMVQGLRI